MQGDGFVLPDRKRMPSIFEAMLLFFIAVVGKQLNQAVFALVKAVFTFMVPTLSPGFLNGLSSWLYYLLFMALPIAVVVERNPGIGVYLRVKELSIRDTFMSVLLALVCVFFVIIISNYWLVLLEAVGLDVASEETVLPTTTSGTLAYVLTLSVLPGVCEELLFRGALLSAWEEKGSVRAIVLTGLLFTGIHTNLAGVPSQLINGLLLGFIVVSTGSIFAGMIFHTTYNASLLILTLIQAKNVPAAEETAEKLIVSLGGVKGLLSMLIPAAALGCVLYLLLKTIDAPRRQRGAFGIKAVPKASCSMPETVVILCGITVCAIYCIMDMLELMGVL